MLKEFFKNRSKEQKFWEWFIKNSNKYFYLERNQEALSIN